MKAGYPMTDYHQPTKRFCQTLELVDDKDSIECDICNRPLAQNQRKLMPMVTKAAISIVYLF